MWTLAETPTARVTINRSGLIIAWRRETSAGLGGPILSEAANGTFAVLCAGAGDATIEEARAALDEIRTKLHDGIELDMGWSGCTVKVRRNIYHRDWTISWTDGGHTWAGGSYENFPLALRTAEARRLEK